MKRLMQILVFGALPALAMAGGDHAGGHGNDDAGHSHAAPAHRHEGAASGNGHEDEAHEHRNSAGRPGDPARATRTVEVTMHDSMRFDPAELKFKAGETVRFRVHNMGKIRHEMVLGSRKEIEEHAEMMRRMPAMEHSDPNMISLAPGEHGELVWQFDQPGSFDFACLVPGHLEAGMTGRIEVK